MKLWLSLVVGLLVVVTLRDLDADDRPNIVVVMVDDMGFSDLGCFGSLIETPVIDQLARQGVTFSSFYNTARCWTTRASLLTGFYPHQVGKAMSFGSEAPFGYRGDIPRVTPFLSELLQDRGYATYHVGKWHLNSRTADIERSWPLGRGFDRSYCIVSQNNFFAPWTMRDEEQMLKRPRDPADWPKDFYMTSAIGHRARKYLDFHFSKNDPAPFFLYVAHTAPHFPLHAPPQITAKYLGKYMHGWDMERIRRSEVLRQSEIVKTKLPERDEMAKSWNALNSSEKTEWDSRMAVHSAMIDVVDQEMGKLLATLKQHGVYENTLILFLSDNGASAEVLVRGDGHDDTAAVGTGKTYECLEVGWSNACNTPFRQHKMWTHEGGISTPLIVHWPDGKLDHNKVTHQVGHVIDIVPTLLQVVGVDEKEGDGYPGKTLWPTMQSVNKTASRTLFWEHLGNKAIRSGKWKAVQEYGHGWQLYDMDKDRGETRDLASGQPDNLVKLTDKWQVWADTHGVVNWATLEQFHPRHRFEYRRK